MKVLLIVHQFFPKYHFGTETYTLQLAQGLRILGHDVVVMAGDPSLPVPAPTDVKSTEVEGFSVYTVGSAPSRLDAFRSSYCRPEVEPVLRRILAAERPDVVHFTHVAHLGSNLVATAKAEGLPCVVSFTDFFGVCWAGNMMRVDGVACAGPGRGSLNCVADYMLHHGPVARTNFLSRVGHRVLRTSSPFWYRILRHSVPFVLPRSQSELRSLEERPLVHEEFYKLADHFIMATEFLQKVYVGKGFPSERMSQITYGVPVPTPGQADRLQARYDSAGSTRPVRFGFIGQIARHKGVDLLVGGFLQADLPGAELKIYGKLGSDPFSKSLRELAGDDPRISFCGTFESSAIYDVLAGIDVLCIPSRWHENAPLVLLNGLVAKTVMLVSDGYGLTQFVKNGVNGRVVESAEISCWARHLHALASEPGTLQGFRQTHPGYDTTPETYARHINRLYHELPQSADSRKVSKAEKMLAELRDMEKWKFKADPGGGAGCMDSFAKWETAQIQEVESGTHLLTAPIPPDCLRDGVRKQVETPIQHARFGIQSAEEFSVLTGDNVLHADRVLILEGRSLNLARLYHGTRKTVTCAFTDERAGKWANENIGGVDATTWSLSDGIPLPDASVRLVLCGSLMQHLRLNALKVMLCEVSRVLMPGGRALLVCWGWSGFGKLPFNPKLHHSLGLSLFSFFYYFLPFAFLGQVFASRTVFLTEAIKSLRGKPSGPMPSAGPRILFLSRKTLRALANASGLQTSSIGSAVLRNYLDIACLEKPHG